MVGLWVALCSLFMQEVSMTDNARTGVRVPSTSVEFIGPVEARILLDNAAPNRTISTMLVLRYAVAMLDGDWHNIGDPIRLDERGRLSDGQHRLTAIMESETVQEFTVMEGVPLEQTIMAVDMGRKRTIKDILQIISDDPDNHRQIHHIKNLPPIARRVLAYEKAQDTNVNTEYVKSLSNKRLVDYILANQNTLEAAARGAHRVRAYAPMSAAGIGAAHAICASGGGWNQADEFMSEVCDPSQTEGNPAWLLRNQAMKDGVKRTFSWTKDARLTSAMYIKAFNHYVAGTCPRLLTFKAHGPRMEPFPLVEPF